MTKYAPFQQVNTCQFCISLWQCWPALHCEGIKTLSHWFVCLVLNLSYEEILWQPYNGTQRSLGEPVESFAMNLSGQWSGIALKSCFQMLREDNRCILMHITLINKGNDIFYNILIFSNKGAAAQNKAGNGDLIVLLVLSTLRDKTLPQFWDILARLTKQCYVFVSWCITITNKHIINVLQYCCIASCTAQWDLQSWGSAITTKVGLGK